MVGQVSVHGAGTGLSQARLQAAYQARVMQQTQAVVRDTGSAALQLIQTALADPSMGKHLDVYA